MTSTERIGNLIAVVLPGLALIAGIVMLWNSAVDLADLAVLGVMYLVTGLGITVGYHRLLTHRAFQTRPWIERAFAIAGSMAVEGAVLDWVADHRKHHAHADVDGDPHSPHVGHGAGWRGAAQGLLYAHVGWLLHTHGQADWRRYARELYENPVIRRINKLFLLWAAIGLLIPTTTGFVLHGGSATGALRGLLWGGLIRAFLVHHVTWSVNSVCHFFGKRRFSTADRSTNVLWLAFVSLGESWHNNHHAFPRSADHGLRRWELDPSAWLIRALEHVGLAWGVVRISTERQAAKLSEQPTGQ